MSDKHLQFTCTLKYAHFNSTDVVTVVEKFDIDTPYEFSVRPHDGRRVPA